MQGFSAFFTCFDAMASLAAHSPLPGMPACDGKYTSV
jgi:hypothetical protein